jgi:hypothetical protein
VRVVAALFLCACSSPAPVVTPDAPGAPDAAPAAIAVPHPVPLPPPPTPDRKKLAITLRSTPPGAIAAIDGRHVGLTPMLYQLPDDGRDHEFSFALAGHASWRVRFVPVSDGVVHGRLRPFLAD